MKYILHYRRLKKTGQVEFAEKEVEGKEELLSNILQFLDLEHRKNIDNDWSLLRVFNKQGKVLCVNYKSYRIDHLSSGVDRLGVNTAFLKMIKYESMSFRNVKYIKYMSVNEQRVKLKRET